MPEYIGSMTGIGDELTGANEITPKMMAAFLDNIINYGAAFVLKNAYNKFNATIQGSTVTLETGAAAVFGFVGAISMITDFIFSLPASGFVFYSIYVEFNISNAPAVFSIKTSQGAASDNFYLLHDNLRSQNGVYQFALYTVKAGTAALELIDKRQYLLGVHDTQYINGTHIQFNPTKKAYEAISETGQVGYVESRMALYESAPKYLSVGTGPVSMELLENINDGDVLEMHFKNLDTDPETIQRVKLQGGKFAITMVAADYYGYGQPSPAVNFKVFQYTPGSYTITLIRGNDITNDYGKASVWITRIYRILGGGY